MIAALCWAVSALADRIAVRKRERDRELTLGRVVLAWKRDRYDLDPALRVRTRIPKVGHL